MVDINIDQGTPPRRFEYPLWREFTEEGDSGVVHRFIGLRCGELVKKNAGWKEHLGDTSDYLRNHEESCWTPCEEPVEETLAPERILDIVHRTCFDHRYLDDVRYRFNDNTILEFTRRILEENKK